MPLRVATSVKPSTSHGVPNVWVAKMAEVRIPIAFWAAFAERVNVSGSISAKTGLSPFQAIACAVAAKVKGAHGR